MARKKLRDQKNFKNYAEAGASRRKNTFKGLPDIIKNADEDIGENKETLVARSRQLFMSGGLAAGAIKKIRTNVVGKGLRMKSTINNTILGLDQEKAEEIENSIECVWDMWASTTECDLERFSNFYQLQALAILTMLIDGECFVLLPFRKRAGEIFELKIQLIDSARCDNPPSANDRTKNGVELDEDGVAVAYYFKNDESGTDFKRIETFGKKTGRKNILVLMDKERIGQRRGTPLLAQVIESLHQIRKFTEAELMNAALSALFSVFIEHEPKVERLTGRDPLSGVTYEDDEDGDRNLKLGTGNIMDLEPGQKITFADPQRPNAKFDSFVVAISKQLGSALEIPFEILLNNFNTSYSAARAALLEVWKMYQMRREWFVTDFCQPIFEEFMDEVVGKGYLELEGYHENPIKRKAYLGTQWYGQAQGQLNPIQEVRASVMKIEAGLSTIARETSELNGSNFVRNCEQLKTERRKMQEVNDVLELGE